MRGWKSLFLVLLSVNILGVAVAGPAGAKFVQKRGGWAWIKQQFVEVKTGTNGPVGNLRLSVFESLPDNPGDVYMVGDSLTAGCEWAELLRDPRVRNRGIYGDTTAGVLARVDEIARGKPRVFLMIGVNDLHYGCPVPEILDRYRQIVARLNGCEVYAQSILPVCRELYHCTQALHPEAHEPQVADIQALNEGIRQIVGRDRYVDLWPALVAEGQLRQEYTFDGLHVNGDGYAAWVQVIRPRLAK